MGLIYAYCFLNGSLVSNSVVNMRQKDNIISSLVQTLGLESSDGIVVCLYRKSIVDEKKLNNSILVDSDSIKIRGTRFKKQTVEVSWLSETNNAAYYSEEEMQLISENIEAMMASSDEEFIFPHEIPIRTKEVDSSEKEFYIIEEILPFEVLEG